MLLFRSREEVTRWCRSQGRVPGAIVSLPVLQRLGANWYGDRLDPSWRPRTRERSQAILAAAGLTGAFWLLG